MGAPHANPAKAEGAKGRPVPSRGVAPSEGTQRPAHGHTGTLERLSAGFAHPPARVASLRRTLARALCRPREGIRRGREAAAHPREGRRLGSRGSPLSAGGVRTRARGSLTPSRGQCGARARVKSARSRVAVCPCEGVLLPSLAFSGSNLPGDRACVRRRPCGFKAFPHSRTIGRIFDLTPCFH